MIVLDLQVNQFLGKIRAYDPESMKMTDAMAISADEKCIYIAEPVCNDLHTYDLRSLKRINTFKGQKCTVCTVCIVYSV
jgi:sugar lactone lactonase YvrE